jgi:clan AA aspartic protease
MTRIELINLVDEHKAAEGLIPPDRVRRLSVVGLVDTGAVRLALPADVVSAPGLVETERRQFRLADGTLRELSVAGGLRIEILDRQLHCDAVVRPAGSIPLIGQIPLEGMDLVVDPKSGDVMANPAHPDFPVFDLLSVA